MNRAVPRDITVTLDVVTEVGTGDELVALLNSILQDSKETYRSQWEAFGLYTVFPCEIEIEQPMVV